MMDATNTVEQTARGGETGDAGLRAAIDAVVACVGPGTSRPANDPGIDWTCVRKARRHIDLALGECDVFELDITPASKQLTLYTAAA